MKSKSKSKWKNEVEIEIEVDSKLKSKSKSKSKSKTEVEIEIEVDKKKKSKSKSKSGIEVEVHIKVTFEDLCWCIISLLDPLLFANMMTRRNFLEKSQVFFTEVKTIWTKKEKSCFGALFCAAFCLKTIWTKKQERATIRYRWPPPTKIYEEFSEAGRISTATSRNDTIGGESCAIHMLENSRSSIGAGQSSKLFEQYKHFILLWAPCHRSKICHFFSDVLNRNFWTQTFKT